MGIDMAWPTPRSDLFSGTLNIFSSKQIRA
jgi:hypothetical protein